MFFSSPPRGRWRKTSPITLRRILLVRPITYVKYMRKVYPCIPGSGLYVDPSWAQPVYNYLLVANSCDMYMFLCSVCDSPIESLIYFYGLILVEMCSFLFHITQILCLGEHKIVEQCL